MNLYLLGKKFRMSLDVFDNNFGSLNNLFCNSLHHVNNSFATKRKVSQDQ